MNTGLHPLLNQLGPIVDSSQLGSLQARALASYLEAGMHPEARLLACQRSADGGIDIVLTAVRVQRPQDLAVPIRREEPIAVAFRGRDGGISVLSAREDFPEVVH